MLSKLWLRVNTHGDNNDVVFMLRARCITVYSLSRRIRVHIRTQAIDDHLQAHWPVLLVPFFVSRDASSVPTVYFC